MTFLSGQLQIPKMVFTDTLLRFLYFANSCNNKRQNEGSLGRYLLRIVTQSRSPLPLYTDKKKEKKKKKKKNDVPF